MDTKSRLERLIDSKSPVLMPAVSARYLLDWLSDLGWAQSNGMGATPLSAAEISAWCGLMRIDMEIWEVEILRAASRAYCAQSATKDIAAPWRDDDGASKSKPGVAGRFKALANMINRTK